ncbi:MAG: ribosomal protein S18-alanine N-acetyltransferase [Oscillospiraceae bacterium]|nr:ribosomal protein S18-alanine N-acetyltransferase [Oscillospiraceae bacterium]
MIRLKIRPMCREDIPEVAELDEMCFSVPWSAASLEGELDNELADWLVADLDGTIAGYVGAQTVLDEADLMNLAVHPELRRHGVAKALLTSLMLRLYDRGARSLTLDARVGNVPAVALYRSLGFEVAGRRKNYYEKPKEDAYIFRRELKGELE